jgi:hypothetical protein
VFEGSHCTGDAEYQFYFSEMENKKAKGKGGSEKKRGLSIRTYELDNV